MTSYPYSVFSSFDQTALIRPSTDSFAWSVASKLSFDLGRKLGGTNINIVTHFADAVPDDILMTKDLLLVGRPSLIPVISQMAHVMPAPFESGSDIAQEKEPQFSYSETGGIPVGYIEIFTSPWDSRLAVLSVLGNEEDGLDAAASVLLTSSVRNQLAGNLIVALNDKVIVDNVDTTTNSQTSPSIVFPGVQNSDENIQTENNGGINISLSMVVLMVVVILAGLGIVILLVKDRWERHGNGVGGQGTPDKSEETK